jgi:hypothetical protein
MNKCQCGCGQEAPISKYTDKRHGAVKGQSLKFIVGHNLGKGPACTFWKGGRSKTKAGYVTVYMPDHPRAHKGHVFEHIIIAEKALGKQLPPKAVVHHHNPMQLVICQDQAYHLLLHRRKRAIAACGHANWRRCWVCKQYDDHANLYHHVKAQTCYHSSCIWEYMKQRAAIKQGAVNE